MFDTYTFGALTVTVDQSSGEVLAVNCRTTGLPACLVFSPGYIAQAITQARAAWACTAD